MSSRDYAWDVSIQGHQGLLEGVFVEDLGDGSVLKCEGQNSVSRTHIKMAGVVKCTCNPIPKEPETGGLLEFTGQLVDEL